MPGAKLNIHKPIVFSHSMFTYIPPIASEAWFWNRNQVCLQSKENEGPDPSPWPVADPRCTLAGCSQRERGGKEKGGVQKKSLDIPRGLLFGAAEPVSVQHATAGFGLQCLARLSLMKSFFFFFSLSLPPGFHFFFSRWNQFSLSVFLIARNTGL